MIEININLVFTIINLIVLYLLMKKFLFGPILNVMEQRKNMIDQQFASAKETEEKAYELKGKYEDALKSAKDESMRIVNQAKDEAKVQADRIVKDANTQAGEMLDKAKADSQSTDELLKTALRYKSYWKAEWQRSRWMQPQRSWERKTAVSRICPFMTSL